MTCDDDLRVRPGRIGRGDRGARRPQTFVGEVMRAARRAGHVGDSFRSGQGGSRSRFGRGRQAAVSIQLRSNSRRVVMKARGVGQFGSRFRSAPLNPCAAFCVPSIHPAVRTRRERFEPDDTFAADQVTDKILKVSV